MSFPFSILKRNFLLVLILLLSKYYSFANASEATTGKLFEGVKIRNYVPIESNVQDSDSGARFLKLEVLNYSHCVHWSVTTTIFDISEAIIKFLEFPEKFCMVVVADNKTPSEQYEKLDKKRVLFLSVKIQKALQENVPFIRMTPWNSFSRKNIGYAVAIAANASTIWDMDDDNIIYSEDNFVKKVQLDFSDFSFYHDIKSNLTVNPLPFFLSNISEFVWPRGFPLENIKTVIPEFKTAVVPENPLMWQSIADNDPDVDAIFRLTKNFNLFFKQNQAVILNNSQFSPLNAQSCIFYKPSFFTLYLPFSVHGRVSDIWRGYVAEGLLRKVKGEIIISSPLVIQHRNSHNYLADFMSEKRLYDQSGALVNFLNENFSVKSESSVYSDMTKLYVSLYERGFIELSDVKTVIEWTKLVSQLLF